MLTEPFTSNFAFAKPCAAPPHPDCGDVGGGFAKRTAQGDSILSVLTIGTPSIAWYPSGVQRHVAVDGIAEIP